MSKIYNLPVPFFSQRECKYVWYQLNNDGTTKDQQNKDKPGVSLAWTSCNMTSLCMILHYFGITNDSPNEMLRKFFEEVNPDYRKMSAADALGKIKFGEELKNFVINQNGYSIPERLIKHYAGNEAFPRAQIKDFIMKGCPVWFSFGAATAAEETREERQKGHIAVIRGVIVNGNNVEAYIINDPWGDVADPFGFLHSATGKSIPGTYYSHDGYNYDNPYKEQQDNPSNEMAKYMGLGSGDNCILRSEDFNSITGSNLFQAITIEYPHVWSFPYKDAHNRHIRFSTHEETEDKEGLRTARINNMFSHEVPPYYPLSQENHRWHDGIHIKAQSDNRVYAIGPGRLLAARIQGASPLPDGGSSNFVLVRHEVRVDNADKIFFSSYTHLGFEDIQARISKKIIPSASPRQTDWIDQLLQYVSPKVGIVKATETGQKSNGLELNSEAMKEKIQVYQLKHFGGQDMIVPVDGGVYLQDRAVIYLSPVDEQLRNFLMDITQEENRNAKDFYNELNDSKNYIKKQGNGEFFAFYYNESPDAETPDYKIRYVKKSNIIPQIINMPAFAHYRKKLYQLYKGEVVTFDGEDENSFDSGVQTEWVNIFNSVIENHFPYVHFTVSGRERLTDVKIFFISRLNASDWLRENGAFDNHMAFMEGIIKGFASFAGALIELPKSMFARGQVFQASDNWYKTNLKNTFKELFTASAAKQFENLKQTIEHTPYISPVKKDYVADEDFTIVMLKVLKQWFPRVSFDSVRYENYYTEIGKYYEREAKEDFGALTALNADIYQRLEYSSLELITYDTRYVSARFTTAPEEKWYNEYLKKCYDKAMGAIKDKCEKLIDEMVFSRIPRNIDYFIEVTANTKLGTAGKYEKQDNVIHFEIFSDDVLIGGSDKTDKWNNNINTPKFVEVSETDKNKYFNCTDIVHLLRSKEFYKERTYFRRNDLDTITHSELLNYYTNLKKECPSNFIITNHLHGNYLLAEQEFYDMVGVARGFDIDRNKKRQIYQKHSGQAWFSKDMAAKMGIEQSKLRNFNKSNGVFAVYYHPIRFLEWLDRKLT